MPFIIWYSNALHHCSKFFQVQARLDYMICYPVNPQYYFISPRKEVRENEKENVIKDLGIFFLTCFALQTTAYERMAFSEGAFNVHSIQV